MPGRPHAFVVVTLLLAPILAGCIAEEAGPAVATIETASAAGAAPAETPDGRGAISAFKETNATEKGKGGMAHSHDVWGGDTRKLLVSRGFGLFPIPLTPRNMPPATAIADFNIPAPNLVYEGTSAVEITFNNVTVVPSAAAGEVGPVLRHPTVKLHVWYLTAADDPGEWRDAGAATPDQPLIIPVEPLQTDMPHSVASLWLFRVFTDEPSWFWVRNMTITAVKGGPIVNWPPHPDLYARSPQRVIFDGPAETRVQPGTDYLLYGEDSNWFRPERVISYGTERLQVDVAITEFTTDVPGVAAREFYLDYHNASFAPKIGNGGTSGGSARDPASDGTTYRFEIPVTEFGFDSPYGTASRWAFRMLAAFDEQGLEEANNAVFCANCVGYTIRYTLRITAFGHSTADEGIDDATEEAPPAEDAGGGRARSDRADAPLGFALR